MSQFAPDGPRRFQWEHLAAVCALATERGIRLDIPGIFAVGRKP